MSSISQMALAMEKARKRRTQSAIEEFKKPENLALKEYCEKFGRDEVDVSMDNVHGRLYFLHHPDNPNKFKVPEWQGRVGQDRMSAALKAFHAGKINQWIVHDFMVGFCDAVQSTPAKYLEDRTKPIAPLLFEIDRRVDLVVG